MNISKLNGIENEIQKIEESLTNNDKAVYFEECQKKLKDPDTYAVLSYFLLLGLNNLYLKAYEPIAERIMTLLLSFSLIIFSFINFSSDNNHSGVVSLVVASAFLLYTVVCDILDIFNAQKIVRLHNLKTKISIMENIFQQEMVLANGKRNMPRM